MSNAETADTSSTYIYYTYVLWCEYNFIRYICARLCHNHFNAGIEGGHLVPFACGNVPDFCFINIQHSALNACVFPAYHAGTREPQTTRARTRLKQIGKHLYSLPSKRRRRMSSHFCRPCNEGRNGGSRKPTLRITSGNNITRRRHEKQRRRRRDRCSCHHKERHHTKYTQRTLRQYDNMAGARSHGLWRRFFGLTTPPTLHSRRNI